MYTYEQRMAAVKLYTSSTIVKQRQLSENWDIQTATCSSSGSKNMNPLGICIRRVVVKENRSFLTNKNKLHYSFIRSMATVSL